MCTKQSWLVRPDRRSQMHFTFYPQAFQEFQALLSLHNLLHHENVKALQKVLSLHIIKNIAMIRFTSALFLFCFIVVTSAAQKNTGSKDFAVIAYYAGRTTMIDSFEVEKLTHLIFSFCHLKRDTFTVSNARDSATILRMVELKKRNPRLKIILSLGGWGGCQTCSPVFSTRHGRRKFSKSVKQSSKYFGTDGIDLDWEYPVAFWLPGP